MLPQMVQTDCGIRLGCRAISGAQVIPLTSKLHVPQGLCDGAITAHSNLAKVNTVRS
jgi:hypothetical protein